MDKEPQIARLTYIIYSLLENKNLEYLSELTAIPIEKIQLWANKFNWEHRPCALFHINKINKSTNPDDIMINFFNQLINKIENSNEIIESLEIDEVLKLLNSISRMMPGINKINGKSQSDIELSKEDEIFLKNFISKPEAMKLAHKLLEMINC
ncbi:MAG TPA: hypothetical protein P5545_05055 [Bacteroidota bacterium]|nr:hypothetical protein [Candidatus Kapabacteria bacterium]HRS01899.1 hypothetical protein [Bacteroidota bacterium]HRT67267.1 hypothetical protein [Bacteroidota bacterium]